jgi:hypothetical protein
MQTFAVLFHGSGFPNWVPAKKYQEAKGFETPG